MISFDEARGIVKSHGWRAQGVDLDLDEARGRRLFEPFRAAYDSPPFSNSAMDGYAVGSLEGPWRITGIVAAGSERKALQVGEAMRIFTGAVIPEGTAAVVPQEDCVAEEGGLRSSFSLKAKGHIREQGEEFGVGTLLYDSQTLLTPPVLSGIASQGASTVQVCSRPRVGLLATGSELISVGDVRREGAVFDSNSVVIASILRSLGCEVTSRRVGDNPEATAAALGQLLEANDVLITVGGVSVGDFDFVRPCAESLGFSTQFDKVAIKPGKPATFGTRSDGKVWFGLPGNPMSAIVTCCLFVLTYIGEELVFDPAVTSNGLERHSGREEFVPARLGFHGVALAPTVGSHATAGLSAATGLCRIASEMRSLVAGDSVQYAPLPWRVA